MANKNGIITRKDIIEDEALKWGPEYGNQVQIAIDKNKEWSKSILEIIKNQKLIKDAPSQKEYLSALQEANLEVKKSILLIKEREAADLSADKIKRSNIATMEAERRQREASEKAIQRDNNEKERSKKLTIEERIQNEINNKALKQEALERLGLVSAYTKLNKARAEAKDKLRELIASESASTAEIKKAQKEFERLDVKVKNADHTVGDFSKNVGNYPTSFKGAIGGLKNLAGAFGITAGVTAFVSGLKDAFNTIKKFDQGIADLSAITGASGKDLDYLKNKAIDLGKNTKGGAIAVVEAYKLIGSAKPELLSNVNALNKVTEATLTLAQASGMEMPQAATALTDAMNQFGAGADEAGKYIDALANGAKYGASEIPQTTEALLKFGAVARSSNISIEESTALIQLLAENGIKGAEAGTALRNVLLKISAPDALPKEAQLAMKDLGISFEMLKDKSIPIEEKFNALKPLLKDNKDLIKVFGSENIVAAQNLIEHTDRLKELIPKMGEYGTAQEQATIRMDTLSGKSEKLASTYDSFILSIGSGSGTVSKFFKLFIDGSISALEGLIRLNTSWEDLKKKAAEAGKEKGVTEFDKRFKFAKENKPKANFITDEVGDNKEIAKRIKKDAEEQYKIYEKEYNETVKKLAVLKKQSESAFSDPYAIDQAADAVLREQERLTKELGTQASIIREAGAFIKGKKEPAPTFDKPIIKEEDKKEDKKEDKDKDKIDKEKSLSDSLYELKKQRLEQFIKLNEEIVANELESDEARILALTNSQIKQHDLLVLERYHLLEKDKLNANDRIRINEDYSYKIIELNEKTKEKIDKINEFDSAKYQKKLELEVKGEQTKENNLIAKENEKFKKILDNKKLSEKQIEEETKKHEERLFQIKKDAAIAVANLQANNLEAELLAFKAQSDGSAKSTALITDLELKLSEARKKLTELGLSTFEKGEEEKSKSAREQAENILNISSEMTDALAGLSRAFSEAKIAKIDEEINKTNEYYDKQIELAGNDNVQKELLEKEREKKNAELEKKKKDAKNKQAKIDKAVAIAQVTINTALAVIKGFSESTYVGAVLAGVLGAISLATIIATPIPKYKHGRKGGREELAYVGDGGVSEVIERVTGKVEITPATDTLVKLNAGDKVHSSVDEYLRLQKASLLTSIDIQGRKVSDFQANQFFEKRNKELVEEMRLTRKAIEKNKSSVVVNTPKLDINHELWKMKNTNWN